MKPMHHAYWTTFLLLSLGAGLIIYVCWPTAVLPVAFWTLITMFAGAITVNHLRGPQSAWSQKQQFPSAWEQRRDVLMELLFWATHLLLVWLWILASQ